MIFSLKDWEGKPHNVSIPDGSKEVAGIIVTGDEILVYPVYRDPMLMHRMNDYLEGHFHKVLDESGAWIDK